MRNWNRNRVGCREGRRGYAGVAAVVLAGLILAVAHLPAQTPEGGFYLNSPLKFSLGREQKTLVGGGTNTSNFALLEQSFSWTRLSPRTELIFNYTPEFEIFAENRRFNSWNHLGGVRLSHRVTPRLKIEGGDNFLSTSDPARRMGGGIFLLPRSRYTENSLYFNTDYLLSPTTSVFGRVDNTIAKYDMPPSDLQNGFFDQMGLSFTGGISRQLNHQTKLTGSYSLLRTYPLIDSDGDTPKPTYHHVGGGVKFTLNPTTLLEFNSGWIYGSGGNSWTISASAEKQVRTVWFGAGYSRHLAFFGGPRLVMGDPLSDATFARGLMPNALYQSFSVRMRGRLTQRLGTDLEGYLTRSNRPETNREGLFVLDRKIRGYSARARFDFLVTERVGLFAQGEYYDQNHNEFLRIPVHRNRASVGIEIHLTSSPNPIVYHRDRTRQAQEEEEQRRQTGQIGTNNEGRKQ